MREPRITQLCVYAALYGHLLVVLELLKIKAVYDNGGAWDNEALRFAAGNGHLPVV